MEPEHINQELLKKIQKDLKTVRPKGRGYGRFIIALRVFAMVLVTFISTLAMSFFLYDLGEKTNIFEFTQSPILENMANFLFEFFIISLVGVGCIYIIYRQTDWPLVKERLWLIVGAFILIGGMSVGLVLFSRSDIDPWGDFIGDTTHGITRVLPLRSFIEDRMENDLEENSYFIGSITNIATNQDDVLITVQNDLKAKIFRMKNAASKYVVTDKVIIRYADEQDGDELRAKEIKKL